MIETEFNNANFDELILLIEKWSNQKWNNEILSDYDDKMGKGVLFILELEKGLAVTMSDSIAKDDIAFINKAYTIKNNACLTLNYLTMGDVYIVKNKKERQESKRNYILNKTVLQHSKSDFSFIVPKGKRARAIDIVFSHEWLLNQFKDSSRQSVHAIILKIENQQSFYIDAISSKSFEITREISDKIFYAEWDYVFFKSRILLLIDEFINTYILGGNSEPEKRPDNNSLLAMTAIKQKINATVHEKLPNRKILAKEFLMSESSLDRHFKQHFGTTITAYHLKEKMELAKRILGRNEYTISQIAYLLGYETVSAFIKTFKKHFGTPPSLMRKNSFHS